MKGFPCMWRGQAFSTERTAVWFFGCNCMPRFCLVVSDFIQCCWHTNTCCFFCSSVSTNFLGDLLHFKSSLRICWHVPYKRPDLQVFKMVLHWPSLTNLQALCFVGVTCQRATWMLIVFTNCFSTFELGRTLKKVCFLPIVLLLKADLSCYMQVLHKVTFSYNRCYRCYTHSVKQVLSYWFQGAVIGLTSIIQVILG